MEVLDMKKIICMLLSMFLVLSLVGCKAEGQPEPKENASNTSSLDITEEQKEDVSMFIKEETLTAKSATFVLQNNTEKEYTYDLVYSLEKQTDGKWQVFEPIEPLSWAAIVMTLQAGEKTEFDVDWTLGYNELTEGTYRLVKNISDSEGNRTTIYAEFDI